MASVLSINISNRKGIKKTPLQKATFLKEFGIEDDAHAGKWHRQVSLLDASSIEKMKELHLNYGDFAENLTTSGLRLYELPIGTKLLINDVVLEVTQIGKECHNACAIKQQVGDCVMPREGIFARVIQGGVIETGDEIKVGDHV